MRKIGSDPDCPNGREKLEVDTRSQRRRKQVGKLKLVVLVILVLPLLAGCGPSTSNAAPAAPTAVPATARPLEPLPKMTAKQPWEERWGKTIEEAKREGQLLLAVSAGDLARRDLGIGFQNAFGIRSEVVNAPSPLLISKILAERKAGLYLWDAIIFGPTGTLNTLKPAGALDALDTLFILPDLTQQELIKTIWYGGELPWADRDHTTLVPLKFPSNVIAINTNLVKPGEIKTYRDLLNTKWLGRVTMRDPTVGGVTLADFLPMFVIGGMAGGTDFVRELAATKPLMMRDERLQMEWLAQGKVAILIGSSPRNVVAFKQAGAPVDDIQIEEGIALGGSTSAVSAINRPSHFNAAKLFVNWYLSKEGQTVISKALEGQSARLDVPTDFIPPKSIRQPGGKTYNKDLEENLLRRPEVEKLAIELFGPLLK